MKLCKIKYYNWSLFHSVQPNFVAQAGDPSESGTGGESIYKFDPQRKSSYFSMQLNPKIKHKKLGLISMVNNGQNMHGSQFLITLAENLSNLDGKCTVFGYVSKGIEVLEEFNKVVCNKNNRPLQDIR